MGLVRGAGGIKGPIFRVEKRYCLRQISQELFMKIDLTKQNSRTLNSVLNFTSSIGGQLLNIFVQFAVRTVFIHTLGKSYLGIGGLFSNILSMLSLVEFGVGSAILFKLYEPLSTHDEKRINILMYFYKKVYFYIGLVISCIGICLIPFLRFLIKDYDRMAGLNINVTVIFLMYLFKTVSSYLFLAYKSSIIKADQKEYLVNLVTYLVTILAAVVQIVLLLIYPKFEIYVTISILQVVFLNLTCAFLADKMYPFIKENSREKLARSEVIDITKDCSALFLYKLNGVVLKATDNIILSAVRGLDMVALYSNYYVFYTSINTLFSKVFNSVSHSLGNLHTTHNVKHEYEIYEVVNLIAAILGGTAGVGIFVVSNPVVHAWIGDDWLIEQPFSMLMGIEVLGLALRQPMNKYRATMGLFQQAKYRPVAGMIINLVVSYALVSRWGICGVLVGTIVADWTTVMWYDPIIIHKYGFNNEYSPTRYFLKIARYMAIIFAVGAVDYLLCNKIIGGQGWFYVILYAAIVMVTVPAAMIGITSMSAETRFVINKIRSFVVKKLRRS